MVGLKAPPKGEMKDNDGKPIYFDSIDNSAYIMGKSPHSARESWMYMDGESFGAVRADIGGDPKIPTSGSPGNTRGRPKTPGSVPTETRVDRCTL